MIAFLFSLGFNDTVFSIPMMSGATLGVTTGDLLIIRQGILVIPEERLPYHFLIAYGLATLAMFVVSTLCFLFSALTDNSIGHFIRNKAREQGVDTSYVQWTKDDRAGIYFVEFGANPRPSRVIYDRSHSAMSMIKPGEVDWAMLLKFLSAKHLDVSAQLPLPELGEEIVRHAARRADASRVRALMVQLDDALYGGKPIADFRAWKRSFRRETRPRLFARRPRSGGPAHDLPALNPSGRS